MKNENQLFTIILFTLTLAAFLVPEHVDAQQATGESLLTKGDTILVYVDQEDFEKIKASAPDDIVTMKILENVDRFGNTLITKFTPVYCTIDSRSGGGMYGKPGKMTVEIDSTHSTAGTMIPLKGEAQFKGKGKGVLPYIPPIILFGWLIKGSDITFPEGDNVFKPVVEEDTPLEYLR
jgi:hypothetical protein